MPEAERDRRLVDASRVLVEPALAAVAEGAGSLVGLAARIADAVADGHRIFVFGAGHASMFGMELVNRAGGFKIFDIMHLNDLTPGWRPFGSQLRDSEPERVAENGTRLLSHYGAAAGDIVLVASNSGRNGSAVQLALDCAERGIYTAAFTSLAHSRAVASRHVSGKRLFEVADLVVDNHVPLGDAMLADPRLEVKFGAASSLSFCLLAQMLDVAIVDTMLARGLVPDLLLSANV